MGNISITSLLGFFGALSVATAMERITEIIKGFPGLSRWFAVDKTGTTEEFRKASVQIVAIVAGTLVSYLVREPQSGLRLVQQAGM